MTGVSALPREYLGLPMYYLGKMLLPAITVEFLKYFINYLGVGFTWVNTLVHLIQTRVYLDFTQVHGPSL